MRRFIPLLILALLATTPAPAQFSEGLAVRGAPLFLDYDPGTSYVFCKYTGITPGQAFGEPKSQPKRIKNTGSDVDATSFTTSDGAFTNLAVGDWIQVRQSQPGSAQGIPMSRYIVTYTDADNITVNVAWDLSIQTDGYPYVFRKMECGTGAENGWISTGNMDLIRFSVAIDQLNATSADVVVQCRDKIAVATPVALVTKSYTAVGGDGILISGMLYDECRFGAKVTTDTGVQKITVSLRGI